MEKISKNSKLNTLSKVLAVLSALTFNSHIIQAKENITEQNYCGTRNPQPIPSEVLKSFLNKIKVIHPNFDEKIIPQNITSEQLVYLLRKNLPSINGVDPYLDFCTPSEEQKKINVRLLPSVFKSKLIEINNTNYVVPIIKISHFTSNTLYELLNVLNKIRQNKKLAGIIIDVENNPGGDYNESIKIADLFLRGRLLISQETHIKTRKILYNHVSTDDINTDILNINLIFIQNKNTASAAEVMIRGTEKRKITPWAIGQISYGKNVVQTLFNKKGFQYRLTTARWTHAKGGIMPTIFTRSSKRSFEIATEKAQSWIREEMKKNQYIRSIHAKPPHYLKFHPYDIRFSRYKGLYKLRPSFD